MPQTATVISAQATRHERVDRWFYISVAVAIILLNALGFGPSILNPSERIAPLPLTPVVTVHAIVASAWLLFFLTQATLVATRRTAMHRRLGIAGGVLAAAFVVVATLTTMESARRGFDLSGDLLRITPPARRAVAGRWLLPLISNIPMFAVFVGAALFFRRRPAIHKRLMLLATVGPQLTGPPVIHAAGHWPALLPWAPAIALVTSAGFLSASAIHDRISEGRIHPVSIWGPLLLIVWDIVSEGLIGQSAAWDEFAAWMVKV